MSPPLQSVATRATAESDGRFRDAAACPLASGICLLLVVLLATSPAGAAAPTADAQPLDHTAPDCDRDSQPPSLDDEIPSPGADDEARSQSAGSSGDGPVLAVLAVLVGGLGFRYAYRIAQIEERIDAIGSTTPWEEVEPAGWKVFLNKLLFGAAGVAGLVWLLVLLFRTV